MFTKKEYLDALSDGFTFSGFKSDEQQQAIECVVNGEFRDMIVSIATHGGKSLIYQFPRAAFQRDGIVLVISPFIGLITNQVAYLNEIKIPATSITSVIPEIVRRDLLETFYDDDDNPYMFLYVTPEMLEKGNFKVREMIDYLFEERKICLVAVDDAHKAVNEDCSYRVSYRFLRELRHHFDTIPWIALTTASHLVIESISRTLGMNKPKIIKGPSTRSNIFYDVKHVTKFDVDLIEDLIDLDEKPEEGVTRRYYASGIVYCQTYEETDRIADFLSENGISSESFYGTKNESTLVLKRWKDGVFPVICATEESLGSGIIRTPLQFVVHNHPPKNMRAFYQASHLSPEISSFI